MYRQKGFTLIELVVVIVILGLLAATALPRFIDLTGNARGASVSGVAGGMRSAAALAKAGWLIAGSGTTSITMDGQAVDVGGATGFLAATGTGMGRALPLPDGYTLDTSGGLYTYVPSGGAAATCAAAYDPASGTVENRSAC